MKVKTIEMLRTIVIPRAWFKGRSLPIEWWRFRLEESSRYDMSTPFIQQGRTFSTDGRVLIETDLLMDSSSLEESRRPNAAELVDRIWDDRLEFKKLNLVASKSPYGDDGGTCATCMGHGVIGFESAECNYCDGFGEVFSAEDYDQDDGRCCMNCGGCGRIGEKCPDCCGKGLLDDVPVLKLGSYFGWQYANAIAGLPGDARFAEVDWIEHGTSIMLFKFDGGRGCLASMSNPNTCSR